ncbi:MAG: hypothetical protein ACE5EA_04860 [Nitrospirota bacterium]
MKSKKGAGGRKQVAGKKNISVISGVVIYILLSVLFYSCGRKGNPIPPEDITKKNDNYYNISEVKYV